MAKPLYLHASHLEKREEFCQSTTSTRNKKASAVSDILNDTDDIEGIESSLREIGVFQVRGSGGSYQTEFIGRNIRAITRDISGSCSDKHVRPGVGSTREAAILDLFQTLREASYIEVAYIRPPTAREMYGKAFLDVKGMPYRLVYYRYIDGKLIMAGLSQVRPLQSGGEPHVISGTWENEALVTPGKTEIDIQTLARGSTERVEINGKSYTLKEIVDLLSILGKPDLTQDGGHFFFDIEGAIQVRFGDNWYGQSVIGDTPSEAIVEFFRRVSIHDNELKVGGGPVCIWNNYMKTFEPLRTRVSKAHDILDTL